MTSSRSRHPEQTHLLWRAAFEQWQVRAGVLSALPGAPVVEDDRPPRRPVALLRRLGFSGKTRPARAPYGRLSGRRATGAARS